MSRLLSFMTTYILCLILLLSPEGCFCSPIPSPFGTLATQTLPSSTASPSPPATRLDSQISGENLDMLFSHPNYVVVNVARGDIHPRIEEAGKRRLAAEPNHPVGQVTESPTEQQSLEEQKKDLELGARACRFGGCIRDLT
ncbi:hypothetical protein PM082_001392 [Marasmius tenuissimus]|nr:hypothetical protein PM082_001392 [Marasmius tenuissimus]